MDDMKASANELQDISAKLKGHDMSEAFSKEIQTGEPGAREYSLVGIIT